MPELKTIVEALLLAADEPLAIERLLEVFPETERPDRETLQAALAALNTDYRGRGLELVHALLPRSGANITRSQAADRAVVHLVLSPPVIHAESILHDL